MAVKFTRDHHLLTRNLKLNDKHISNDGQDEGISIADDGTVHIEKLKLGGTTGAAYEVLLSGYSSYLLAQIEGGVLQFNPGAQAGLINFIGDTSFENANESSYAAKIRATGSSLIGGRLSLTGTSQNGFVDQPNAVIDFNASGALSLYTAQGGFIRNLTHGFQNSNTTTPVTAGGILAIKPSAPNAHKYGAIGVTIAPADITSTWGDGTITLTVDADDSNGSGTGAQFKVVTASGVTKVTLIMNQVISPRMISNDISFDKDGSDGTTAGDSGSITMTTATEGNWKTLGFRATNEDTLYYGESKFPGSLITVSGAANASNNGTFLIRTIESSAKRVAYIYDDQNHTAATIPDQPLTDENPGNVITIYGGGSGQNYIEGEQITLTDTSGESDPAATLIVRVMAGCGDYPSYTTFGTCDSDNFLASERMRIMPDGKMGIGTKAPQNFLSVQPTFYKVGWASQSGTAITGYGTDWDADMVGKDFIFNNGYYAGEITGFTNTTTMAVSASKTVKKQAYVINEKGFNVRDDGTVIANFLETSTTTSTQSGMDIDYDYTAVTAASQTINNKGLDLDINSNLTAAGGTLSINSAGIIINTGIDLDIASGTSGAQHAVGLDIGITGGAVADSSNGANNVGILVTQTAGTHLKLAKDANDYATFSVADTGDLTIATAGDGVVDSDIIIDADGDIELNADGGDIVFKDNTAQLFAVDTNGDATLLRNMIIGGTLTQRGIITMGNSGNTTASSIEVIDNTGTYAGKDLTVAAGSTTTGANNIDGGDLILASGAGDGTGTSSMQFQTKVNGTDAVAERMRIHTNGMVGIGVADPDTTLEVNGNGKITHAGTTTHSLEIDATALTTGSAVLLNVDDSLTASATKTLIHIDYDKSGVTGAGQLSKTTGLIISMADAATNHASGAVQMIGAEINIESANAQGIIAQTGLNLIVAGDSVGDAATTYGITTRVMDGGTDILMQSSADTGDYCSISTTTNGATTISTVDDDGATAHLSVVADGHVEFDGCAVGFDLVRPTYDATTTVVDFKTGNKQSVIFDSGNITYLALHFPNVSGNFVLLLKQDGSGSRTITNYKVYDSGGVAANGSSVAVFAGGSNPTLTTDANHVDIISIFWDSDDEIAYCVASLDFQD